jgi:hypothetical protein
MPETTRCERAEGGQHHLARAFEPVSSVEGAEARWAGVEEEYMMGLPPLLGTAERHVLLSARGVPLRPVDLAKPVRERGYCEQPKPIRSV